MTTSSTNLNQLSKTHIFILISALVTFALVAISCGGDDGDPEAPEIIDNGVTVESLSISGNYRGDDAISIDANGDLYISHLSSSSGNTIYKVSASGVSTVFTSELSAPMGHAFDGSGNMLVSINNSRTIYSINAQGEISEFLTDSNFGGGSLALAADGTIYHTVFSTNSVYKISPDKEVTQIATAGSLAVPFGIAVDPSSNVYVANFSNGLVSKITPGGQISQLVSVPGRVGYLIYANNRLYATGFSTNKIYAIELDGTLSVVAGLDIAGNTDGGNAAATFSAPNGIVASADGKTLYITQKNFSIRKVNLP